jgi:aspartyl-tRNA(Asn)/glutamyl-tRNA(Gln) amidotransferase subunit A
MSVPAEHAFASIDTLAAALRTRQYTSLELTEFFLDRCGQLGPKYNAVVTLTAETAREQARQADADFAGGVDRGPLQGIPYGAKDLLATPGYPTTWGAAPFRDRVIATEATVIRRLRDAGAVLVAKLSMVELAGGLGYRQANAAFNGPGLNPWDVTRWSGGSSSGPGSAVAAGLIPFAIGSETWGSIVTPAAYCGITGVRPTYGRVSRHGAMALSWSMDKLGPMAHTAHDCGLVLAAICGADARDPSAVDRSFEYPARSQTDAESTIPDARSIRDGEPPRFRLATLAGAADRIQPAVKEAFEKSLDLLGRFGTIDEVALPDLPYSLVASTILSAEAAATHEGLVLNGSVSEMTAPEDRYQIYGDLITSATDYLHACALRGRMQRALDELLARYDAILTPTRATVAGPIDRPFAEWSRGFSSTALGGAANVCGLPSICLPNGFDAEGLPSSLELTGRAFSEPRLLALANVYQHQTDWHTRHPK